MSMEPNKSNDNLQPQEELDLTSHPPTPSFEELMVVSGNREDNEWKQQVLSWLDPKKLESLQKYVHKERRRLQMSFVTETLAALLVVVFWIVLWLKKVPMRQPLHAIGAVSILFVLVWVARYLSNLKPVWSAPAEDREMLLHYVYKRQIARVEWLSFYQRAMVGLAVVLALWTPWMFWSFRDAYMSQPWRAMVGFGGWIVILGIVFAVVNKRKQRTQKSIKVLLRLVPTLGDE